MVYAILIAVGDYKDIGAADIPTYKRDIEIMHRALNEGLRIPEENIRVVTGNDNRGKVSMKSLAHAIADVEGHLSDEDVFLLYFSGHGQRKDSLNTALGSSGASSPCTTAAGIVFSDGMVMLQSVIDYVSRLAAGGKIVILDCCYSGGFDGKGPRTLKFDQAFSEFAGKGIAVMASTSADETARLWPERKCSVFTGALSQAIMELTAPSAEGQTSALLEGQTPVSLEDKISSLLTAGITRSAGRVSLNDIYDVMMRIITIRNYHDAAALAERFISGQRIRYRNPAKYSITAPGIFITSNHLIHKRRRGWRFLLYCLQPTSTQEPPPEYQRMNLHRLPGTL